MFIRPHLLLQQVPADPAETRGGWTRDAVFRALDARFTFTDEISRTFAGDVFWRCVLSKIQQPEGLLKGRWMAPGSLYYGNPNAYRNGYIWDTAFMVDVLSWLPESEAVVREVMENYWDWQRHRDAMVPESMAWRRGVVGGSSPAATDYGVNMGTQNPLFAWAIQRCDRHRANPELVDRALPGLDAWHEWIWRERSLDGSGLCVLGNYGGRLQGARDEQGYDVSCDTDEMRLMAHPARPDGPAHYGDLWTVGFTSYVIRDEEALVELAQQVGDAAMAQKWRQRVETAKASMRERLWNPDLGTFCNRFVHSGAWAETVSIGSWMALYAGVPTPEQAEQMAATLATPEWMTPMPMPTVGRTDPKWECGTMGFLPDAPKHIDHLGQAYNFWRGDVWPPTSYHVAAGLQRYGYDDLAARICDATIMNALRWGDVNERYCCDTGKPLGVPDYGMSACVFAMMTDGMTRRFAVSSVEVPGAPDEAG